MIHFNAAKNFCTPSYYVQKLLGNNLGKQNLLWTETGNSSSSVPDCQVGVGSWNTQVSYDDVEVKGNDGSTIWKDDFSSSQNTWNAGTGSWSIRDGELKQTASSTNCTYINTQKLSSKKYTYKLRAKKNGGWRRLPRYFQLSGCQ